MAERPILFGGPMVRAILAGAKTQTRRVVTLPRWAEPDTLEIGDEEVLAIARASGCLASVSCPFGAPGDVLWVRETWRADDFDDARTLYAADMPEDALAAGRGVVRWTPSIHMPRGRSRLSLRVTSVRVERLHAITEEDARAEGVASWWERATYDEARGIGARWDHIAARRGWGKTPPDFRGAFGALWSQINGAESWGENPWVWAIGFERAEVSRG